MVRKNVVRRGVDECEKSETEVSKRRWERKRNGEKEIKRKEGMRRKEREMKRRKKK